MSERPITFPKTSDRVWANRETGVRIVALTAWGKRTGQYEITRPHSNVVGWQHAAYAESLSQAREVAARVAGNVRNEIAAAYVEAVAEHAARAADAAEAVGAPTWRAATARRMIGYAIEGSPRWLASAIYEVRRLEEWTAEYVEREAGGRMTTGHAPAERVGDIPEDLCLRADPPHIPHMKAVTPECREEQSGCTKASEWLTPHAYEYDPDEVEAMRDGNGGYDEYERCEKSADDPIHAPELQPKFPAGTPEYEAYAAELKVELGKFARGEHPYEYEQATAAMDDEDSIDEERASADYVRASEVIAEAQTPEVAKPMRLAAPADVDDDEAWRRYCEALPAPTDDDLARVMVEFANPYAVEIDAALQAFRTAARNIWYGRRTGTLTEQRYRVQREVMATMRVCIRTYKELAGEWARRSVAAQS